MHKNMAKINGKSPDFYGYASAITHSFGGCG